MEACSFRMLAVWLGAVTAGSQFAAAAIPDDPDFALQWSLHNVGQSVQGAAGIIGADIEAAAAWDIHPGAANVTVAIVGRGIDPHPEFVDRLLEGFATVGDPYDSLDGCNYDTQLAGIIAAKTNDGVGIAGLHGRAGILPVRVMTGCSWNALDVAEGIRGAADAGAQVILVAVQDAAFADALAEAVEYAGERDALVIAPAGGNGNRPVLYPAALEPCLAVTATTNQDALSPFSNFGPEVDISAPGRGIWSTAAGTGYTFVGEGRDAGAAAAAVAGVAALLRSYNPHLTAAQVRQALLDSVDDLGSAGWDEHFGAGRVNARKALLAAPSPALRIEHMEVLPLNITPGIVGSFRVRIQGVAEALHAGSPTVISRVDGGAFSFQPLTPLPEDQFLVPLGPAACGSTIEYYIAAASVAGSITYDPLDAPSTLHGVEAIARQDVFTDDFETDQGWEVIGGDNQSGRWSRVAPNGTSAQPGFDYSPDAGRVCFVTGQHFVGGLDGANDVDGGPMVLTSPSIELPPASDYELSYARWFYWNAQESEDFLLVEVSRNDGSSWAQVEQVASGNQWIRRKLRLSEFPTAVGSRLRVRFSTSDVPNDSLTEAAIDEFRVLAIACTSVPGDLDSDGDVDLLDFRRLFDCLSGPTTPHAGGECGRADLSGDGRADLRDYRVFQSLSRSTAD